MGAGVTAQEHIVPLKLRDMRIVAVCGKDEQKATMTSKEWKVKHHYADFVQMLEREDPSVVSILTPLNRTPGLLLACQVTAANARNALHYLRRARTYAPTSASFISRFYQWIQTASSYARYS